MNEEQNVNPSPKPKKKRSFWWLKLLLILILVAAGVIGGIMLSSQEFTQQILNDFFPQYAFSTTQDKTPVPTAALDVEEKEAAAVSEVTPTPKPSKAPVEIVSPEAQEKKEVEETAAPIESVKPEEEDKAEVKAESEEKAEASAESAPDTSPAPEALPAFAPVTETPAVEEPIPAPAGELIGIDAALEAALKHAGVEDKKNLVVYGVSREKDDGIVLYEVEFLCGNREFEYEINAYTGAVEGWKVLREKQGVGYGANANQTEPAAENAVEPADEISYIGIEEAKETALSHAGYREHETTDMNVELEIDNNKVVYEVEFWAEGYDYDYKVCARTGLILMVEKDRD